MILQRQEGDVDKNARGVNEGGIGHKKTQPRSS